MLDTPRRRARIPLVFLQELDSPTRSTISLTLSMFRLCSCVCCLLAALWFSLRSSFHFAPSCIAACCVIWLWRITCTPAYAKSSSGGCNVPVRALVVLGSGGHTAEMMTMMRSLVQQNMQFSSVLYALAATDSMSRFKAENSGIKGEFAVVPRAREVGQSYATSALTTARAFVYSCLCVMRYRPQLLLCNGPGTCVPFAIAASMCRFFGLFHCSIVYVESFARVKSLSMSGRIMYHVADKFVVQWLGLRALYPRAVYAGVLC